jgi:hypothetical protein
MLQNDKNSWPKMLHKYQFSFPDKQISGLSKSLLQAILLIQSYFQFDLFL